METYQVFRNLGLLMMTILALWGVGLLLREGLLFITRTRKRKIKSISVGALIALIVLITLTVMFFTLSVVLQTR